MDSSSEETRTCIALPLNYAFYFITARIKGQETRKIAYWALSEANLVLRHRVRHLCTATAYFATKYSLVEYFSIKTTFGSPFMHTVL